MPYFNQQPAGIFGGSPQPGGIWGPVSGFLGNHSNMLMQAGLGMLSGNTPQEGFGNAARGLAYGTQADQTAADRKREEADRKKLADVMAKIASSPNSPLQGPYADLSMADPGGFGKAAMLQSMKPADMPNSYEEWLLAQEKPGYGAFLNQGKAGQGTDDQRELTDINRERAASGLKPYRLDEWITTRAKAGATGIQLPAEVGARIGMGDGFLEELNVRGLGGTADNPTPSLRERIKTTFGGNTAQQAMSRAALQGGIGDAGEIWRRVETGKEALVRQLTGAGMATAEAQAQASRYSIGPTDSVETMLHKMDGLEADLLATKSGAIGARSGGMVSPNAIDPNADPLGIR